MLGVFIVGVLINIAIDIFAQRNNNKRMEALEEDIYYVYLELDMMEAEDDED